MRCLYCHQFYQPDVSWQKFFTPTFQRGFCSVCHHRLERLNKTLLCRICGREMDRLPNHLRSGDRCKDCVKWENQDHIPIVNRSVYRYTPFMKDVLARFKFRGDACLAEGFRGALREVYRLYFRRCLIIPIPLSSERLSERHFNQAERLADQLKENTFPLLIRPIHDAKQSKKSRQDRLATSENPFQLNPEIKPRLDGRRVVLIDDIYTTGTTVRLAAQVVNQLHPKSIGSLTLARAEAPNTQSLV